MVPAYDNIGSNEGYKFCVYWLYTDIQHLLCPLSFYSPVKIDANFLLPSVTQCFPIIQMAMGGNKHTT